MLGGTAVAALLHDTIGGADRLGVVTGALEDGVGDRGRLLRLVAGEAVIVFRFETFWAPGDISLLWMDVAVAMREFVRGDLAHGRPARR